MGPVLGKPAKPVSPRPSLARLDKPVATVGEVALVLVAGFLFNVVLRVGFTTLVAAIGFSLVMLMMVSLGRAIQRDALALVGLALVLTPWLALRTDVELTAVTVLMILVLLSLAAGVSIKGSLFDIRVRGLVDHLTSMPFEWFYGLGMVTRLAKSTSSERQGAALMRGVAVAAPVILLFGLLLASADEVFARFLLLGNLGEALGHVILTAAAAFVLLAFLGRRAHETPPPEGFADLRRLGQIEVKVVLGSVVLLFAGFVATQIVVAIGGADHVLRTEGLTQADHARQGFFQLLAVAGLSMVLVGVLRAGRTIDDGESTVEATGGGDEPAGEVAATNGADRFTPLALATLFLTLAIAGISVQRLLLYVGSFGLTPDRLWAILIAGAIGVAIVLYMVSIAGYRSEQSWYPAAALLLSVLVVLGLNVMNPDATIAQYNIAQFGDSAELDVYSLSILSNDATRAIVTRLGDVQDGQAELVQLLCAQPDRGTSFGFLEYNRAAVSSDNALDELCGNRLSPNRGD